MYLVGRKEQTDNGVEYIVYNYTNPNNLLVCSYEEIERMYNLDDLQNAIKKDGRVVEDRVMQVGDIFIKYFDGSRYAIVYKNYDNDFVEKLVTFTELYELYNLDNILNGVLKDGEYISNAVTIPEFSSGKFNNLYKEVYKRFLLRAYDLYCIYSVSGKSSRSPVPYKKLDEDTWHWLRQRMRTFHTAEYNDWMRLLSATL